MSKLSLIKIFSWSCKYILFFSPTTIIIMLFWTNINDNLYYCSDKIPFLDFFPPFVHKPVLGDYIILSGDYFIVNEQLVWSLWIFLISLMFLIPYYLVMRTSVKRKVELVKNTNLIKHKLKSILLLTLKLIGIFLTIIIVLIVIWYSYALIRSKIDSKVEKQIDIKFHKELLKAPQLKVVSFKLWERDSIVQAEVEKKGTIMFWYGIDGVPTIDAIGSYSTTYDCFYVNKKGEKRNYAYSIGLSLGNNSDFNKWFSFKVNNLKDIVNKYDAIVEVLHTFPKNPSEIQHIDISGKRTVVKQPNKEYILYQEYEGRKVQCDIFSRL